MVVYTNTRGEVLTVGPLVAFRGDWLIVRPYSHNWLYTVTTGTGVRLVSRHFPFGVVCPD